MLDKIVTGKLPLKIEIIHRSWIQELDDDGPAEFLRRCGSPHQNPGRVRRMRCLHNNVAIGVEVVHVCESAYQIFFLNISELGEILGCVCPVRCAERI